MTSVRRIVATIFGLGLGLGLGLGGCESGAGHPPTARIALMPAYVPLDDGYQTDVVLDGSGSRGYLAAGDAGDSGLTFQWTIDDPHATIAPSPTAPKVTARISGAHPVAVHLTVTDALGESTTSSAEIGVTISN